MTGPGGGAGTARSLRPNDGSSRRLRTPAAVQRVPERAARTTPNRRRTRPRLRSFRGVVRHRTRNCIEAAITAAVILEQHGYPPLVMSLESIDELDHVHLHLPRARPMGIGGSLARSRACTVAGPCSGPCGPSRWSYCRPVRRPDGGGEERTARLICGCSATTTGVFPRRTCGRWSGSCSRFRTGRISAVSGTRIERLAQEVRGVSRSEWRTEAAVLRPPDVDRRFRATFGH